MINWDSRYIDYLHCKVFVFIADRRSAEIARASTTVHDICADVWDTTTGEFTEEVTKFSRRFEYCNSGNTKSFEWLSIIAATIEVLAGCDIQRSKVFYKRCMFRELTGSTAIGRGVAVPHFGCPELEEPQLAIVVSKEGFDFGSLDGEPTDICYIVMFPVHDPPIRYRVDEWVSRSLRHEHWISHLRQGSDPSSVLDKLQKNAEALDG